MIVTQLRSRTSNISVIFTRLFCHKAEQSFSSSLTPLRRRDSDYGADRLDVARRWICTFSYILLCFLQVCQSHTLPTHSKNKTTQRYWYSSWCMCIMMLWWGEALYNSRHHYTYEVHSGLSVTISLNVSLATAFTFDTPVNKKCLM